MKKKILCALSAAVMLAGCGDKDFSELYGDYLDYAFDSGYIMDMTEEGILDKGAAEERGYKTWTIIYSDKNGYAHESTFTEEDDYEKYSPYGKDARDAELYWFICNEMSGIAERELYEQLVSAYYPVGDFDFTERGKTYHGDGYTVYLRVDNSYNNNMGFDYDHDKFKSVFENAFSTESGYKLSDCTLKSTAEREEFMTTVIITLDSGEAFEKHKENMDGLIGEYEKYVGKPMNYYFDLKVSDDSGEEYCRELMLGEAFESDDTTFLNDELWKKLSDK